MTLAPAASAGVGGFGFGAGMFGIGALIMIACWVLVTLAPAVTHTCPGGNASARECRCRRRGVARGYART